ncbi:class I SAM-dependent methyltransferase [Duganella callida]|uniref:Methyltransferase n=1 Tax=Duganella callida TaxID=2561932 RepID=A0A4Y9S2Y3_9BURK|nr:class I SAM-dependent methyltransferase [Duganella callida]TFW15654.1 methyltransferase [Duganella callida]
MSDWTSGYVADIAYTYGYYAELNPLRARLLLLNSRLVPPRVGTACELGFGQGVSVNIHAAASGTRWYGTDFNPSQAGFAQQLASSYSDGAQLYDQAFAEFCARDDLPDFDYIALHGIWSWISDHNRDVIVDFLRRKLKVGGILYLSYNTQPGWTAMVPVRDLLTRHAEIMTSPGAGMVAKVDNAITFARKLWAANPAFARAHPQVAERLKAIEAQDRHYVAHEYFNRDWLPMSFAKVADWLEHAKLNFACSATAAEHVPEVQLTAEQRALLDELPDPVFRQSVRDFMINQQFRRDYWVKGPRQLTPLEHAEQISALRVVLFMPAAEVGYTLNSILGQVTLSEAIYKPVLQLLADHQPRTIGQLAQALREYQISLAQVQQAAIVLMEKGALAVAQDDEAIARCRPRASALNRVLLEQARGGQAVQFLASPVLGGGVTVERIQQLFLLARVHGKGQPGELADYAWALLKAQGQALVKDGATLQGDEQNLAELNVRAEAFSATRLPLLIALGVVD